MIGINDVVIAQVCRSRLVSNVYRVLKREVPDREGLKLSVASADSTGILVVEL